MALQTTYSIPPHTIHVIQGDLTQLEVHAIVNAANSSLLGGGGVDGAIHGKGGPAIYQACQELRDTEYQEGLPTGQAVLTTAGKLPARYVIHTVGPIWKGGDNQEEILLADCYRNSLSCAARNDCTQIGFPAISTGVYLFPKARAAQIALHTVMEFLSSQTIPWTLYFVLFDEQDYHIFIEQATAQGLQ